MKTLLEYIQESNSTSDQVYTVYFGDHTMYQIYNDKDEAEKVKDDLNKESADNKCYVKPESKKEYTK